MLLHPTIAHKLAEAVPLRDDGSYDRDFESGNTFRLRLIGC